MVNFITNRLKADGTDINCSKSTLFLEYMNFDTHAQLFKAWFQKTFFSQGCHTTLLLHVKMKNSQFWWHKARNREFEF